MSDGDVQIFAPKPANGFVERAEFGFGQVESILAEMHNISDHKRVAFAGRLKMLQKNGLPIRERTGRGKAGSYNFSHLVQLATGLELLQSGVSPQRAASLVAKSWPRLVWSLVYGSMSAKRPVNPPPGTIWRADLCWLSKLDDLYDLTPFTEPRFHDVLRMEPIRLKELGSLLGGLMYVPRLSGPRSSIVIMVGQMMDGLATCINQSAYCSTTTLFRDLRTELWELDQVARQWLTSEDQLTDDTPPWSYKSNRYFQRALGEEFLSDWAKATVNEALPSDLIWMKVLDGENVAELTKGNLRASLMLARYGVIDFTEENVMVLTPLGEHIVAWAKRKSEASDVDPEA